MASVLVVGGLGAYFIGSALGITGSCGGQLCSVSIQQTSAFQLDGNAQASDLGSPASPGAHDWDQVCFSSGFGCSGAGSDGAFARSFESDPISPNSDPVYTGGNTKDGLAINGAGSAFWQWNSNGSQAKDDLEHAFAAQYNGVSECDNSNPPNCDPHSLLFFGADRLSNGGDSDIGFWFMRGNVGPAKATPTSTSGRFTGHHSDGDVLVLSTFVNGGSVPQVQVLEWQCPQHAPGYTPLTGAACDNYSPPSSVNGGSPLFPLTASGGADCLPTTVKQGGKTVIVPAINGPACATTNLADGTAAPWAYTEKSSDGNSAGGFGHGTFFEGGLDTTALGLDKECFSTVITETRSSQSVTAILEDFAAHSFAPCNATMVTTPSSQSVLSGDSVTDSAVITGAGLGSNSPAPTSDASKGGNPVTWTLCGPLTSPVNDCGQSGGTAGTTLTPSEPLTEGTPSANQSTAGSPKVDTTGLTPGSYYCFGATWAGDSNYLNGASDSGTNGSECFFIQQLPTTTVTTPWSASNASGSALGTDPLPLGTQAYDKAVVTGTTAGGTPTGTVTFYVCNPSQVTGAAGSEVCAKHDATTQVGSAQTVPASTTASTSTWFSSPAVNANIHGVWCFAAVYVPGGTNGSHYLATGSNDSSHGECFTINKANTTTVTSPMEDTGTGYALTSDGTVKVHDHATVQGNAAGGPPDGSVEFWLCGPDDGTGHAISPATALVTNPGPTATCSLTSAAAGTGFSTKVLTANTSPANSSSADSDQVTINHVGQYCFYARYEPATTSNYNGSEDGTTGECFTVTDSTGASSMQKWVPNDSATITSTGGSSLDGTLTFTLYPNADCNVSEIAAGHPDPVAFQQLFTLTGAQGGATGTTKSTDTSQATGSNGVTVAFAGPVTASGSWSWFSDFESTNGNVASSHHCESTTLSITN